jgi:hypothetical protein
VLVLQTVPQDAAARADDTYAWYSPPPQMTILPVRPSDSRDLI